MDIDDYGDHAAVNCGPTHHHACACREAYFEERLAALQKTVDFERKMVANESAKLSATRDKLKEAARLATESAQLADGLAKDLAAANDRNAGWEKAAESWFASPEAAQRLEGYRELALKVNAAELALAAANERAGRLEAKLRSLCERLDEWWYEADPMGDVKKGERHPWTVAARKALEVPDAL